MSTGRLLTAALSLAVATFATAASAAPHKEPIVTYEWVQKNLENPKVRIIEVSVDPGVYERGHIPGALNISWHTDLVDKVSRDIVSRENFEKLVQKAGIDKEIGRAHV